jgi:hypothetical protein
MMGIAGAKYAGDELGGIVKTAGFINRFLSAGEQDILDAFLASRV